MPFSMPIGIFALQSSQNISIILRIFPLIVVCQRYKNYEMMVYYAINQCWQKDKSANQKFLLLSEF